MANLYLSYTESESGGEVYTEDEDWPNYQDAYRTFEIKGLHLNPKGAGWEKELQGTDFDPQVGQTVYIVLVRYTDGDSFSCIHGCWYIVKICQGKEEAEEIAQSINKGTHIGYGPWKGYFADLESCEVVSMVVE